MQKSLICYLEAHHPTFIGKASCKIIATVHRSGKKAPTPLKSPEEVSIEDILALETFQEAS